jgi:hypothetical protein
VLVAAATRLLNARDRMMSKSWEAADEAWFWRAIVNNLGLRDCCRLVAWGSANGEVPMGIFGA